METSLGWVLSGSVPNNSTCNTNVLIATHVMKVTGVIDSNKFDHDIVEKIGEFWDIENSGLNYSEDLVLKYFHESIQFDGKNYSVRLPWKCNPKGLPDNFSLCKSRLNMLVNRLSKNPTKFRVYDDIIKQWETDGVIESVDHGDFSDFVVSHYIPHRAVEKEERKTTKTRIVMDASAHRSNYSALNDCLETGPCLLPKLFDILVRFRCWKYALLSDIKSAFLNIRIDESDRDFLRFLWIDNIESEALSLCVKRFMSLIFGLKCSPFILLATVNHHMRKHEIENREFAEKFLLDLYMDDNPTGLNDPRVGFEYYLFVKTVMKKAGFLLRKWLSNNKDLLEKINDYEKLYFQEEIVEPTTINKVLGVIWNIDSDELIYDITEIIQKALETAPNVSF